MKPFSLLRLFSLLLIFFLFTACNPRPNTPIPTQTPLPEKTLVPTLASTISPTSTPISREPVPAQATPTLSGEGTASPDAVRPPSLLPPGAVTRFGKGELSTIVYSPDGHFLAVGTSIGVCLYDSTLWEMWCDGSHGGVHRVAFRQDNEVFAAAMNDGRVVVWETQTGAQVAERKITSGWFEGLAWTPDGQIVTGSGAGDVGVWEGTTLKKLTTWDRHSGYSVSLYPSPDGSLIAGAIWNAVFIYNSTTGERIQSFPLSSTGQGLVGLGWLADGETLLSVSTYSDGCGEGCGGYHYEGALTVWNVSTGEQIRRVEAVDLLGQEGWFWGASVNPEGTLLALGTGAVSSDDVTKGAILILDPQTFEILATYPEISAFTYDSFGMRWTPDNRLLIREVTQNVQGGDVLVWTPETGAVEPFLTDFSRPLYDLSLSPDGWMLASLDGTDDVRVWDANTGELLRTIQNESVYVEQIVWHEKKLLYSGHAFFGAWDFSTGQGSLLNIEAAASLNGLVWSPTGDQLTLVYSDTVTLLDPADGALLTTLEPGPYINAFSWAPDGQHLALSSDPAGLEIWNVDTGQVEKTLPVQFAYYVTWTSDGTRLAGYTDAGFVIWDVQTGAQTLTLPSSRHKNGINALAFNPDGTLLATAGNEIILWDTATGEFLGTLEGHGNSITALAFSPDGKLLYSASYDGTIIVWEVP